MEENYREAREVFIEAVALATAEERARYLDEACQGRPELRGQVEELLEAHTEMGGFLTGNGPAPDPLAEGPGTVIGHYKLLEEIGEGAFGRVFMAEQVEPVRRKVAIKIVKPGMDSREVVARFEAERQALALMDHPNIAKVHDAGTTETGRPYFVMELVRGLPVTKYCDEHDLPMPERLRLFTEVCHAVQHAHQKGVIHRDLKPTNILVTEVDGNAVPKVIDFGVAKALGQQLTEKTLFTAFQQLIGTPAYMSPEQTALSGADVDTRSDVYSLGVLLYELLTGATPLDTRTLHEAGLEEMRRMIRETEPPKPSTRLRSLGVELTVVARHRHAEPSTLTRLVCGDLDWIVMKALEKDRARRYQTISALAEDIDRHLASEPVSAGPPSMLYRARKFVRRHKMGVALSLAAVVAVLLCVAVLAWGLVQTRQQRDRAELAEQRAESEAAIATAVNKFLLEDLLGNASPEEEPDRDIKLRTLVDRASERAAERFKDQPFLELEVRDTLFCVYHSLRELKKARAELERAKEICRQQQLGGTDGAWLRVRSREGGLLLTRGFPVDAQAIYEEILPVLRRVVGDEDPVTLSVMRDLATALTEQGKHAKGQDMFEVLLPIQRKVLGDEAPPTLSTMCNLAVALSRQGKHAEAQEIDEEILSLQQRVLGPEKLSTLLTMNNLAADLLARGKYAGAQKILDELIPIQRKVLRPEHPEALRSMRNLACVLREQGKHAEAEALFEKVLEIQRRTLREEHPETLRTMTHLAVALREQGKHAEAQALLEKVLEIQRRTLREEHPDTLGTMDVLAWTLFKQGKRAEAQARYAELLPLQRKSLEPGHPDTANSVHNLGVILNKEGKLEEARKLYADLLADQRRVHGTNHRDTLHTMRDLAGVYRDQGKLAEAQELWEELLRIQHEVPGPEKPETLATMNGLAEALHKQGKPEEARRIWKELLEIQRRVKAPSHHLTVRTENNLAGFDEAEEIRLILRRAWDAARSQRWPEAANAYGEALAHPGFDYQKYERERWPYTMALGRPMAITFLRADDHGSYEKLCRLLLSVVDPERPSVNFSQQFFLDGGTLPRDLQQRALELGGAGVVYWSGRPYPKAKLRACETAGIAELYAGDLDKASELLEQAEEHPKIVVRAEAMLYHAMALKKLDHDDEAGKLLEHAESLLVEPLKNKADSSGQDWLDLEVCEVALWQARKLVGASAAP